MQFWVAAMVAIVTWVIVKEEIVKELRFWFEWQRDNHPCFLVRKLAYIPTCEFCCSFWVTLVLHIIFQPHLAFDGFRGILLSQFATWALANVYMTGYSVSRVCLRCLKLVEETKGSK